jgi:hypothetical protein
MNLTLELFKALRETKRELGQRRPGLVSKETYYRGKRTYNRGKRDLL